MKKGERKTGKKGKKRAESKSFFADITLADIKHIMKEDDPAGIERLWKALEANEKTVVESSLLNGYYLPYDVEMAVLTFVETGDPRALELLVNRWEREKKIQEIYSHEDEFEHKTAVLKSILHCDFIISSVKRLAEKLSTAELETIMQAAGTLPLAELEKKDAYREKITPVLEFRSSAAAALVATGGPRALELLQVLLVNETRAWKEETGAGFAGREASGRYCESLLKILLRSWDRDQAVEGLLEILGAAEKAPLALLEKNATGDIDAEIRSVVSFRMRAVRALAGTGDPRAVKTLLSLMEAETAALGGGDMLQQLATCRHTGHFISQVTGILKGFKGGPAGSTRLPLAGHAGDMLAALEQTRGKPLFKYKKRAKSERTLRAELAFRTTAVRALAGMVDDRAVDLLLSLLKEEILPRGKPYTRNRKLRRHAFSDSYCVIMIELLAGHGENQQVVDLLFDIIEQKNIFAAPEKYRHVHHELVVLAVNSLERMAAKKGREELLAKLHRTGVVYRGLRLKASEAVFLIEIEHCMAYPRKDGQRTAMNKILPRKTECFPFEGKGRVPGDGWYRLDDSGRYSKTKALFYDGCGSKPAPGAYKSGFKIVDRSIVELGIDMISELIPLPSWKEPWPGLRFPASISRLRHLRKLYLRDFGGFHALFLPESLGDLEELEVLVIAGCRLPSLPASFTRLQKLRDLTIKNCHLPSLPGNTGELVNLQTCDLSGNMFYFLPESLAELVQLKKLNLAFDRLITLPAGFGRLQRLEECDLHNNIMLYLPESMADLHALVKLDIGWNSPVEFPSVLFELKQLKHLDIEYNKLASLPGEIWRLENLEYLGLSGNKLVSLPVSFSRLQKLERLDLAANAFEIFPAPVLELSRLKELCISINEQLSVLPEEISCMAALEKLDIDSTNIISLPVSMGKMMNLKELNLPPVLRKALDPYEPSVAEGVVIPASIKKRAIYCYNYSNKPGAIRIK